LKPRAASAEAWCVALAAAASLLPRLSALWPARSYYFRDFTVTFYPLRLFQARELAAGRWPGWNPYVQEGSFALPALYPLDLLHVLWPGPAAVSWLLTLHFPLAAATAYWLARQMGGRRAGAVVAGSLYALGGLAVSSLNLYVFLQALALAPLVVAGLRRAADRGGRAIPAAALVLALSLTTLAVEFVVQAVLLGCLLGGLAARSARAGLGRLAAALALGAGMAALPIALVLGIVGQTVRGAGFASDVALGNELHPVALLQTILPGLFGSLAAPVESWWGGAFFTKGFPYFLTLYLGPLALALAAAGLGGLERRTRWVMLGAAALGLWYALGARGGLAPLVSSWPVARWFRFPVKAVWMPYAVVCLLAGLGVDRLRAAHGWRPFAAAAATIAALCAAVAWVVLRGPALRWAAVDPVIAPAAAASIAAQCLRAAAVATTAWVTAVLVGRGRAAPGRLAVFLGAVAVADVAAAAVGTNPQVPPAFFAPLPEMKALRLDALDGGRVFSYGPDRSPAFQRFLGERTPGRGLWSFFITRQMLAPYANVIDRVECPEAKDLTAFVPRAPELAADDYRPEAVASILPRLRNAAVSRVVSLDALAHPELRLLSEIPAGPTGLRLHVYGLEEPWPRAYLGCRVLPSATVDEAMGRPFQPGFDPSRDVALEQPSRAECTEGEARRLDSVPGQERYEVQTDGPGYLVTRDSYAPGWQATVDGRREPVLRANGKHRTVAVPAGRHVVELRYHPPHFRLGLTLTVLAVAASLASVFRPVLRQGAPG
jgi:hypothetical protein